MTNEWGYTTKEFTGPVDFMKHLIELGLHDRLNAVFPIEPELIPQMKLNHPILSVDTKRMVTGTIMIGSTIRWNDTQQAWIADLNVQVTRIEVKPRHLRSI